MHEHEWVDVTAFGSTRKRLWCGECGATAWQTFAPVNISTRQDERDLVTRVMWNDGSDKLQLIPVPMQARTFEPLEIDQEGAVFCADTPA